MAADQTKWEQVEQEDSVLFGLKWSLVGFALALCLLAGCSGIFNETVPRYNSVQGTRRPPMLNQDMLAKQQPQAVAPSQQQHMRPPMPMQQQTAPAMQPYPQPPMIAPQAMAAPAPMAPPVPPMQAPRRMPDSQMQQRPQLVPAGSLGMNQMPGSKVEQEMAALEHELQASRQQQQALQQPTNEWMPNLDHNGWLAADESAQPVRRVPSQQPAASMAQPPHPIMAAPQPAVVPEPPVIDAPAPRDLMADAPVKQDMQATIDVPFSPAVQPSAPSATVPLSLIPPDYQQTMSGTYLPVSRYTGYRSHLQKQ